MIKWNKEVKFIIADVDNTIADVYTDATPSMINDLEKVLSEGIILFLMSGGGKKSIIDRVISKIKTNKQNIILAHCSGAEIIGFDEKGKEIFPFYYSSYDQLMNKEQKKEWREITNELISEFKLEIFPPVNPKIFALNSNYNPNKIIFDDRGPQITLELVNAEEKRGDIVLRAREEIEKANLPVDVSFAGNFAIDFHLKGVNKTSTVKRFIEDFKMLEKYHLSEYSKEQEKYFEVWGDKFYADGSDFKVCKALDPKVRTIDFRKEDPKLFEHGYNIVVWDGEKTLEAGLEEYLENHF
jgi:hydroxymethylpyrimidine pyrophosphatase-like HAD family hydrolase